MGRETFAYNEYAHAAENIINSGLIHTGKTSVITTLCDNIHTGKNVLLIMGTCMLQLDTSADNEYLYAKENLIFSGLKHICEKSVKTTLCH